MLAGGLQSRLGPFFGLRRGFCWGLRLFRESVK